MSLFLSRPAVLLLATVFVALPFEYAGLCPLAAHAHAEEVAASNSNNSPGESGSTNLGRIVGSDDSGVCYQGSFIGPPTPCPKYGAHPHIPVPAIVGIVVAVVLDADFSFLFFLLLAFSFLLALLFGFLFWRNRVRNVTDDSASSLFDFVPATRPWKLNTNNIGNVNLKLGKKLASSGSGSSSSSSDGSSRRHPSQRRSSLSLPLSWARSRGSSTSSSSPPLHTSLSPSTAVRIRPMVPPGQVGSPQSQSVVLFFNEEGKDLEEVSSDVGHSKRREFDVPGSTAVGDEGSVEALA
ncbi:hypothetical protein GYMLUDRAFT_248703 [Collybiopsis luxurians FD-317 M1]|uniref:Uncharacterized protein n=1 Tax=Collybiopsis luxurians FD-317 M1 TaxID=944289 RepID=A0A0D0BL48_9AGAR|nr:hypothetical protein GYMLUDRAFT_248703 [Collybiopsis luxurians FD-317 M1]